MNIETHSWMSLNLGREMTMKVYGSWGKPVLVFPCAGGTFHEFEDFGMVEAIKPFIEHGKIRVFTVASIDGESWLNQGSPAGERAQRHTLYERYIYGEVVPFIRQQTKSRAGMTLAGCSLGAFHSVNFALKFPDLFDSTIALSGIYRLSHLIGDYMDDNVYFNSPLDYLPSLEDPKYLEPLRRNRLAICCGQGAWENESLADSRALKGIFEAKQIPAWVDIWGYDVHHDWPWWKKQMPYFLSFLVEEKAV